MLLQQGLDLSACIQLPHVPGDAQHAALVDLGEPLLYRGFSLGLVCCEH